MTSETGKLVFKFSRIYKEVFKTDKRYIDIWGGRGRGGSHFGTDYFLFLITQPQYFRGYFIRQAFHDIRDSLFRDFKDRIAENDSVDIEDFRINENEMRITYIPTGNMIMSKGVKADKDRTAKMKSLAGATHILIEEADELGEDDFDQLDLSVRTTKSEKVQIMRVFNPPFKAHWIWRDYILTDIEGMPGYFNARAREGSGLLDVFSWYPDNQKNLQQSTIDKFESFKEKKPEYYYTIIRGLISEGRKGRIFSGWKPISDSEYNEIDARSIYGQDFGSTSPAGLVQVKRVNNRIYLREQNYKPMTEKELAILYITLGLKDEIIICDSAEPLTIKKLRSGWTRKDLSRTEVEMYPQLLKGFNVFPAIKIQGSILTGINEIKDLDVYVTESSINLWAEFRDYSWALDKNKNPTDDPEDDHNHLIDPTRYVITGKNRYY